MRQYGISLCATVPYVTGKAGGAALGSFVKLIPGKMHYFRGADGRPVALLVACVDPHTALLAPCIASRLHHANGKSFPEIA